MGWRSQVEEDEDEDDKGVEPITTTVVPVMTPLGAAMALDPSGSGAFGELLFDVQSSSGADVPSETVDGAAASELAGAIAHLESLVRRLRMK